VLVPFPFDDLSGSKLRPALCLTNPISTYNHIVIAFITSQVAKATEHSDVSFLSQESDFKTTGLKVSFSIRLHRLTTIPTWLIQRKLGVLPNSAVLVAEQRLRSLLSL
jgi:mRNA interferase MazF